MQDYRFNPFSTIEAMRKDFEQLIGQSRRRVIESSIIIEDSKHANESFFEKHRKTIKVLRSK